MQTTQQAAERIHSVIARNVDAYHAHEIDHATFSERQRVAWQLAEAALCVVDVQRILREVSR